MKRSILLLSILLILTGIVFSQSIQVTSPQKDQVWYKGAKVQIKWTETGCSSPYVKINIFKNSITQANFIEQLHPHNSGWTYWTIPTNYVSGKYILRIKADPAQTGCLGDSGVFHIRKKDPDIGIIQVEALKQQRNPDIHRHRAPAIGQPSNASFSIEKIYYEVSSNGKLKNVKVMITYKSKTAFSFKKYKGHPQDGPVYMNCIIWNPQWPEKNHIYAEKGPPTGEVLFNQRLSVKYGGKNHLECDPEIHNTGSGMFQLIFTPSHINRMQGLDTYQKMGREGLFSPGRHCQNSYPPKMAVRIFIHTKEGVKNLYKEFYLEKTHRKMIMLKGETESCPGGIIHW